MKLGKTVLTATWHLLQWVIILSLPTLIGYVVYDDTKSWAPTLGAFFVCLILAFFAYGAVSVELFKGINEVPIENRFIQGSKRILALVFGCVNYSFFLGGPPMLLLYISALVLESSISGLSSWVTSICVIIGLIAGGYLMLKAIKSGWYRRIDKWFDLQL